MKTSSVRLMALAVMALAGTLLVSCVSPIAKRIEKNPEIFAALSDAHKLKVQTGRIEEGMSKPAVFLAWGRPHYASKGSRSGKAYERWSYTGYDAVPDLRGPYPDPFLSNHWGPRVFVYDPYFYYGPPPVVYLPYEARRVDFLNGKVSSWDRR